MVQENGMLFSDGEPMPFSFKLESTVDKMNLIDSYVGVDFSILYKVTVTMKRKGGEKPLEALAKFDCRVPNGGVSPEL